MTPVVCPRCGEWREEEVSDEEISARMLADDMMIGRYCDPCEEKRFQEQLLEESMHPEWGL